MPVGSAGPGVIRAAWPIEQPPDNVEITITDSLFVKAMLVKRAGTMIPQHSHTYDHISFVARGRVRVWAADVELGEFSEMTAADSKRAGIEIKAGVKHTFLTLEDNTMVLCIHDVTKTGEVEIADRHELGI